MDVYVFWQLCHFLFQCQYVDLPFEKVCWNFLIFWHGLSVSQDFWFSFSFSSLKGIFAYLNYQVPRTRKEIFETLVKGLQRLEYRGYDSAGKTCSYTHTHKKLIVLLGNTCVTCALIPVLMESEQTQIHSFWLLPLCCTCDSGHLFSTNKSAMAWIQTGITATTARQSKMRHTLGPKPK